MECDGLVKTANSIMDLNSCLFMELSYICKSPKKGSSHYVIFNRPGVAGAVLQSVLKLPHPFNLLLYTEN